MDTLEAIAKRKSTRSYTSEQLPEETLEKILKAGCAAPVSMANYESLHITVVQNPEMLQRINHASEEALFQMTGIRKNGDYGAQTLILISSTPVHRPGAEYTNVGIVMENMVLAATALGLDSVMLGAAPVAISRDKKCMKELGIPEGYTPLLGAAFGYGAEETPVKTHTIGINRV